MASLVLDQTGVDWNFCSPHDNVKHLTIEYCNGSKYVVSISGLANTVYLNLTFMVGETYLNSLVLADTITNITDFNVLTTIFKFYI